jgi:hydrogenase maturation protease
VTALVAGLGNIFLSDDAFGVEVARRMAQQPRAEGVRVLEVGIRGVHLAYELMRPIDLLVVVDAVSRGAAPGTLFVLDPESWCAAAPSADRPGHADAHALQLDAVFRLLRALGGELPRTRIVGCEPERLDEGMELSERVRAAIDPAITLVQQILDEQRPVRTEVAHG